MEANSTQGLGILLFLVAFVCLAWSMFSGGSLVLAALFVVGLLAAVGVLIKQRGAAHAKG